MPARAVARELELKVGDGYVAPADTINSYGVYGESAIVPPTRPCPPPPLPTPKVNHNLPLAPPRSARTLFLL